jgi:hypothetical protein
LSGLVASVMIYSSGNAPSFVGLAFANHLQFCAAHGYAYAVRTAKFGGALSSAQFPKIRFVRSLLQRHGQRPWVFFTDADAIFTRPGRSLEQQLGLDGHRHWTLAAGNPDRADLVFAGDHNTAFNSGASSRPHAWSAPLLPQAGGLLPPPPPRHLPRRTATRASRTRPPLRR